MVDTLREKLARFTLMIYACLRSNSDEVGMDYTHNSVVGNFFNLKNTVK